MPFDLIVSSSRSQRRPLSSSMWSTRSMRCHLGLTPAAGGGADRKVHPGEVQHLEGLRGRHARLGAGAHSGGMTALRCQGLDKAAAATADATTADMLSLLGEIPCGLLSDTRHTPTLRLVAGRSAERVRPLRRPSAAAGGRQRCEPWQLTDHGHAVSFMGIDRSSVLTLSSPLCSWPAGHLSCVKLLLAEGADIEQRNVVRHLNFCSLRH